MRSHLAIKISEKAGTARSRQRHRTPRACARLHGSEIGVLQVEKKIRNRVKRQMEKTQREYYLNEQTEGDSERTRRGRRRQRRAAELEEKDRKDQAAKRSQRKIHGRIEEAQEHVTDVGRSHVVRNYLDWMLGIPWKKRTRVKKDITAAEEMLTKITMAWKRSKNAS